MNVFLRDISDAFYVLHDIPDAYRDRLFPEDWHRDMRREQTLGNWPSNVVYDGRLRNTVSTVIVI